MKTYRRTDGKEYPIQRILPGMVGVQKTLTVDPKLQGFRLKMTDLTHKQDSFWENH